ncbi:MAG: sigma-70 family RNA polymerase sigma factor [Acidobacteriota bacterium]
MTALAQIAASEEKPSDDEVVRRVLSGDVAIYEILIRRHSARIYRAVRGVLGAVDEVEDVMQQTYLNAYLHLRQFVGAAQFSTWLTRIAVNEALARRRQRGRLLDDGDDETVMNIIDRNTPDPEQMTSISELRETLEREVAALPPSFRTVIVMRDVEGMSTAETADCLQISEDLVRTRLHRARAKLRDGVWQRVGSTL